jgi:hypothetical protein
MANRLHLGVGGKLDSHPARILGRHDRARAGRQRHAGPGHPLRIAAGRRTRASSQRMGTLPGPTRPPRDWRRPRSRPLQRVALPAMACSGRGGLWRLREPPARPPQRSSASSPSKAWLVPAGSTSRPRATLGASAVARSPARPHSRDAEMSGSAKVSWRAERRNCGITRRVTTPKPPGRAQQPSSGMRAAHLPHRARAVRVSHQATSAARLSKAAVHPA